MQKRSEDATTDITSPLLGTQRESADESSIWEVDLDLASLPYLADHRLQGVLVLPGAVYIEMALAVATASLGETPHLLQEIAFQRAIFLSETSTQFLRAVLSPGMHGGAIFQVYTRAEADEQTVTRAAPAHASIVIPVQPSFRTPDPVSLAEIRSRCPQELEGTAFYVELSEHGNQYGPSFQGIERIWRGDGEALGMLRVPDALEPERAPYHLHPVLLDAAAQMVLAAEQRKDTRTVVLVEFDQVRRYHAPGIQCWAHASLRGDAPTDGDTLVGDVRLLDELGRVTVELVGICFKYLAAEARPTALRSPSKMRIAVTATFTADPLEDSLAFWMQQFEMPSEIVFAPYNQPFQQLLDPSSLLSTNRNGLNVVLVRFEDWIGADRGYVGVADPDEREQLLAGRSRYTLPNQLEIVHLNQYETSYLYEEIFIRRSYLKHGITLHDEDCVIDVGANIGLFTLFVQQMCSNARIYAFEPAPPAFTALQINAALYGSNVQVFGYGLSDRNTEAPFTFYRNSTLFSGYHTDIAQDRAAIRVIVRNMLRQRGLDDTQSLDRLTDDLIAGRLESETFMCQLRTLSSIIDEQQIERIDLLKIDAEKSELDILMGIAAADWGKIRQIVIEVHDSAGERLQAVISLLKEQEFELIVDEDVLLRGSGLYTIYGQGPANRASQAPCKSRPAAASVGLEQKMEDLVRALRNMRQRSAAPHFICICPPSPTALQDLELRALFQQLEQQMTAALGDLGTMYLITASDVFAAYPVSAYYDQFGDELGHVPYTNRFFTALGTMIARKYHALQRDPYKVIVLDCDQTLWKGVCGEDGPLRIEIDPPRKKLQEFMVRQYDAGMLLCLCSKNNPEDVGAVFDLHPEMPLKREHIVSWRINWNAKSANIKSLAQELQVGLDSFIFIEDDPVECAEVQSYCPEVLALQLPTEASAIPTFLEHIWAFDHLNVTAADKQRTRLYQQNRQREELRQASLTFEAFLAELALQVRISRAETDHFARAAQLMQRTNQFNTTTIRCTEAEIQEAVQTGAYECLVVEVSDRFGDYGLVGAIVFTVDHEAIVVNAFLLSCRVLGKGVEHRLIARLGEIALERGRTRVDIPYLPTGKNQPSLDFLNRVGAQFSAPLRNRVPSLPCLAVAAEAENGFLFTFPAAFLLELRYDPSTADASPSNLLLEEVPDAAGHQTRVAVGRRMAASLVRRIALELHDVDQILAAREAQKSWQRPPSANAFVAPNNELERTIKGIWQEVLGVSDVGINDKFFELGGTSLAAVLVASEIKRRLDVDISTINLFDQTTISSMAEMLKSTGEEEWSEKIEARRRRGEQRRTRNLARLRRS